MLTGGDEDAASQAAAIERLRSDDPDDWRSASQLLAQSEGSPFDDLDEADRQDLEQRLQLGDLLRRSRKPPQFDKTSSEPLRLLRRSQDLLEGGDVLAAESLLVSLRSLLADAPNAIALLIVLDQKLDEIAESGDAEAQTEFLTSRLAIANALNRDGRTEAASSIYESLRRLYPNDEETIDAAENVHGGQVDPASSRPTATERPVESESLAEPQSND